MEITINLINILKFYTIGGFLGVFILYLYTNTRERHFKAYITSFLYSYLMLIVIWQETLKPLILSIAKHLLNSYNYAILFTIFEDTTFSKRKVLENYYKIQYRYDVCRKNSYMNTHYFKNNPNYFYRDKSDETWSTYNYQDFAQYRFVRFYNK